MTGNGAAPAPITISLAEGVLGFCLPCVMAYKSGVLPGMPAAAITSAAMLVPLTDPAGNPAGMIPVVVPSCYEHVGTATKRAALYVAGGL